MNLPKGTEIVWYDRAYRKRRRAVTVEPHENGWCVWVDEGRGKILVSYEEIIEVKQQPITRRNTMAQITFDPKNPEDVKMVSVIMAALTGNALPPSKAPEADLDLGGGTSEPDALDDILGGGGSDSDDLDSLMGSAEVEPEKPAMPTVEDMKTALAAAVKAKGKDATTTFVKSVQEKLKVAKISDIPEDKRENFIKVMTAFAAKK